MKTTPPTNFNDEKMLGFHLSADSSLILGEGVLIFHFFLSKIVAPFVRPLGIVSCIPANSHALGVSLTPAG